MNHLKQPSQAAFAVLSLAAVLSTSVQADDHAIDFAREILPILSDKCFVCHGPDSQDQSDLRLDSSDAATSDRGGYRAIDPNDLSNSELLTRINDQDDPMPPEGSKPLSERDKQLIEQWILQGGRYAEHWAFVTPKKAAPHGNLTEAIDTMIGKRLSDEGVDFSPAADRATLARRTALIVTGLPMEPRELKQFLEDGRDDAFEHLVDRLLDSPRFGEHQARYWLDAVRYGDTHGLHLDNRRGIFHYRDWVVRAFNNNLPLDQFITWQLAGDLLPEPTLDQLVATGFVRLNPSTGEGGAIPAEFQMKNNFDRVETLGTVFLGMSLTCARCHTHKYDPVEQTEYYQLMAFFNNTAEPAMDGNSYTYGPTVRVPPDQTTWQQWQNVREKADQLIAAIALGDEDKSEAVAYAEQRSGWSHRDWQLSPPTEGTVPTRFEGSNPDDTTTKKAWKPVGGLPGTLSGRAARNKLPNENQVVWIRFEVEVPAQQTLHVSFNGDRGSSVFVDDLDEPVARKQLREGVESFPVDLSAGNHLVRVAIAGRKGLSQIEVRVDHVWDVLAKRKKWADCNPHDQLRMLAAAGPLSRFDVVEPASQISGELSQLEGRFTTSLVAKELDQPRPTRVLKRGEYDLPFGDPVQPDVLRVLSPLPTDAPRNRIGLADWLTSPEHPLVARVLVNRIWQRVFGAGLVRTPEEFGLQGQQPTHPELLDWVAVDLVESGWDLKQLMRGMLVSRTFKQSSAWRDDLDDPENRLLGRASSYRLDAEVLRDIGLWSSGLLDASMGGEGVKPYQPVGLWAALAHPASNTKSYQRDQGQRLYRRSLYVYWKRTSPHPMMTLFDAPDRETSCVRRGRTNTPLQSLGLLNETQRVEMARSLAERLVRSSDQGRDRVNEMFEWLAGRKAKPTELNVCMRLVEQMQQRFTDSPEDATQLLSSGDAERDTTLDPTEVAAWTQLAITMMASDLAILMY
ncbi:MAG: PSD1 and planctomycete cytochrome C domain-containing protein [Planctomycetota bacterium]